MGKYKICINGSIKIQVQYVPLCRQRTAAAIQTFRYHGYCRYLGLLNLTVPRRHDFFFFLLLKISAQSMQWFLVNDPVAM